MYGLTNSLCWGRNFLRTPAGRSLRQLLARWFVPCLASDLLLELRGLGDEHVGEGLVLLHLRTNKGSEAD